MKLRHVHSLVRSVRLLCNSDISTTWTEPGDAGQAGVELYMGHIPAADYTILAKVMKLRHVDSWVRES